MARRKWSTLAGFSVRMAKVASGLKMRLRVEDHLGQSNKRCATSSSSPERQWGHAGLATSSV